MNDNEIVKALECCSKGWAICKGCPYENVKCITDDGKSLVMINALNLINRQKAEIERLEGILDKRCDKCPAVITAIRDFAERLKEMATGTFFEERKYIDTEDIDNLVKEMTK